MKNPFNTPQKIASLLMIIAIIVICFLGSNLVALLIPKNTKSIKPKTVSESVINNIKQHPQEWILKKNEDSLQFPIMLDAIICYTEILENKKCGIKIFVNHFGFTSMEMVKPDTILFNDVEVQHIIAAYEISIEEPLRKQDSINQAKKEQHIIQIIESCNK